ncbi:uncharacterized protein M6B38_370145 [Iris pallida]|uniref:Protein XRI1 n=1 Tax=Iris pallida TaxID=29817 RepID=A0AAX6GE54_IRIPA|nr:uncharacterized protein M6B38_370145 [Iris pallida]
MMALDNYYFDWDPQPFGLGDLRCLLPLGTVTESPMSSEASTGYLQDAVPDWNDRCKRRRVEAAAAGDLEDQDLQGFWDSNSTLDLNCLFQESSTTNTDEFIMNFSMPMKETALEPPKLQEDLLSPPSSSQECSMTDNEQDCSRNSKPSSQLLAPRDDKCERDPRQRKKKVVYPFAVVKPGGVEGDVTLADINERMLMRPTRPVKHPVGEFAFRPCVTGDGGPGLSGKAVVGLTRIHTQGRGTITIIRTRG